RLVEALLGAAAVADRLADHAHQVIRRGPRPLEPEVPLARVDRLVVPGAVGQLGGLLQQRRRGLLNCGGLGGRPPSPGAGPRAGPGAGPGTATIKCGSGSGSMSIGTGGAVAGWGRGSPGWPARAALWWEKQPGSPVGATRAGRSGPSSRSA